MASSAAVRALAQCSEEPRAGVDLLSSPPSSSMNAIRVVDFLENEFHIELALYLQVALQDLPRERNVNPQALSAAEEHVLLHEVSKQCREHMRA